MIRILRTTALWMVFAVFVLAAPAFADDSAALEAAAAAADGAELGMTVDEETLAAARGGSDLHVSENNVNATLEDNVASNLATGDNTVTDGAFTNTMGIPIVIQNSGNNVIIQNSTILNLELH